MPGANVRREDTSISGAGADLLTPTPNVRREDMSIPEAGANVTTTEEHL